MSYEMQGTQNTVSNKRPLLAVALLGLSAIYALSPIDVVPEVLLGPLGYLEDILVVAVASNNLIKNVDKKVSMILIGIIGIFILSLLGILLLIINLIFK